MNNIETYFADKNIMSFLKYALVGGIILIVTSVILVIGNAMKINLVILNTFNFMLGFVFKYLLYDRMGVFR